MNQKRLQIKEIESVLSQKIKDIYKEQLEQELNNISYQLFDRTLIITLEGIVTSPEKLLKENNSPHLAEQVREAIDRLIQPQIQNTIEEVLNVKVVDFLTDTTIDRDLTGAIAIFELKSNDISSSYKS